MSVYNLGLSVCKVTGSGWAITRLCCYDGLKGGWGVVVCTTEDNNGPG